MTATVDTDVLVLAVHASHPRQDRARALLDWVAAGPAVVHLFWPALMGFLRIATHPSIFANPLNPDDAIAAVDGSSVDRTCAWEGNSTISGPPTAGLRATSRSEATWCLTLTSWPSCTSTG